MTINAITSVVQQMHDLNAYQPQITNVNNLRESFSSLASSNRVDFAVYLKNALDGISGLQNESRANAEAFQLGETGIELSDIIIDSQKASISLQLAVQARNRIVQAYSEIMSMPV